MALFLLQLPRANPIKNRLLMHLTITCKENSLQREYQTKCITTGRISPTIPTMTCISPATSWGFPFNEGTFYTLLTVMIPIGGKPTETGNGRRL